MRNLPKKALQITCFFFFVSHSPNGMAITKLASLAVESATATVAFVLSDVISSSSSSDDDKKKKQHRAKELRDDIDIYYREGAVSKNLRDAIIQMKEKVKADLEANQQEFVELSDSDCVDNLFVALNNMDNAEELKAPTQEL